MGLLTKLFSKERKLQIDFCEKNLDRFLTAELLPLYEEFFQQKNVQFKEYQCQSKCEQCGYAPYALVNKEFVTAEDAGALLKKIKQRQTL